jgi:hypothetical protein
MTDYIDRHVRYRQWFCGHSHINHAFDQRHRCVYDVPIVIRQEENEL